MTRRYLVRGPRVLRFAHQLENRDGHVRRDCVTDPCVITRQIREAELRGCNELLLRTVTVRVTPIDVSYLVHRVRVPEVDTGPPGHRGRDLGADETLHVDVARPAQS